MTSLSVLVSGAGIAGPALACWLDRHGFEVTVVEKALAPRPGGQAVDIRGVAREVVERMRLLDRVRAEGLDERGLAFLNRDGRVAAAMPADAFGGEGIVAEIEVLRSDLSRILIEATSNSVEYIFGDWITGLAEAAGGLEATFARGAARTFDLVVGADGPRSGVRALAFGPDQEYVRELGGYTAFFSVPDPGDLDGWFVLYNWAGGRVAGIRPVRDGCAQAMLTFKSKGTA